MDSRAPNEPRIGREPYRQGTGLFGGHFALGPFLPRDAMCCHRVSVCPSARLSQAGILSKPLNTESRNEKARNPDLENFTKFYHFFVENFIAHRRLQEMDELSSQPTRTRQNEKLLSMLSHKSTQQFHDFLLNLDRSAQCHVRNTLDNGTAGESAFTRYSRRTYGEVPCFN